MKLRTILAWCLVAAVAAVLLRSAAVLLAAFAAALLAALVAHARRRAFADLEYRRVLSHDTVPWGTQVEVTTELTNAKWLPLVWLRVVDEWPPDVEWASPGPRPGLAHRTVLDETYSVRWFERVRRRHTGRCLHRGVHRFGPARLEAGDPLGFTTVERTDEAGRRLVVLPKVLATPGLPGLGGRPLVDTTVSRALTRDPLAFAGVRDFRPGDQLRTINWRATARTGTAGLRVNEYEPSMSPQTMLLVNVQRFSRLYQGFDAARAELVLVVAASLAAGYTDLGHAVGLACNGRLTNDWRSIDVEPDTGTLPEILELLARVIAFPPPPFEVTLETEIDEPRPGTDYVVVTPTFAGRVGELVAALGAVASVRTVAVGGPAHEGGDDGVVPDAIVAADFDWRTADVLALA